MEPTALKKIGLWMDQSHAFFLGYADEAGTFLEDIPSSIVTRPRIDGEGSDTTRLGASPSPASNHEYELRLNQGIREIWVIKSYDLGATWTSPENITTQVHRPNHPAANPAYIHTADWRHYANTPGHALQISEGRYKGRLYVAANHSVGDPQERFREYRAHGFYSDDHGKSYQLSESLTFPGSNESTAAPLSQDRLLMSVRNQEGTVRQRILAYSSDGGATWEEEYFEPQLPDPVCQGSLL
ncbi:MAG: hypothetical protein RL403_702, partial [Bacteroidota bacterium]